MPRIANPAAGWKLLIVVRRTDGGTSDEDWQFTDGHSDSIINVDVTHSITVSTVVRKICIEKSSKTTAIYKVQITHLHKDIQTLYRI